MSTMHHITQSVLSISNPFGSSEHNADKIGFVALCAGVVCAIDMLLLSVVIATTRRKRYDNRYNYR